eukprot:11163973-Lingulodinium_polyedra.AAC.1
MRSRSILNQSIHLDRYAWILIAALGPPRTIWIDRGRPRRDSTDLDRCRSTSIALDGSRSI